MAGPVCPAALRTGRMAPAAGKNSGKTGEMGDRPMNATLQDLTCGPLKKQILLFSLPLIASNVLQVLFNMSDVAVVGRFAGAAALGAVGSTTTLITLFTGFLIGLSGGVNVLVAQYFGAKNGDEVRKSVHTAFLVSAAAGLLLAAAGICFARELLELLHTKPELIDGAELYLRIYFLGMPALALYNFGNAVFSAVGDTKKPLCYLTAAGIVNVLLNLFFVIVCRLHVAGVAIASAASQYLSALLTLGALFRRGDVCALRLSAMRFDGKRTKKLLMLGIPAGLQSVIFAIANLFIQAAVNSFDATMVEGNSAAANSDALVYDVMAAFYTACASFIGQNYGAGRRDRVLKSYRISMAYSFGAAAVMGAVLVLFGRQFLSLFTTEEAVISAGMKRLIIMGCSYAFSAFMDCTIAAARGLGRTVVPMIIVISGSCVFRVIWIYTVFACFGTIASLYLLYIFSWTITGAAEIAYFVRCCRRQMDSLRPAAAEAGS